MRKGLADTNEEENTGEDDQKEDEKKKRIKKPEVPPLHARMMEHTARGLVCIFAGQQYGAFPGLPLQHRGHLGQAVHQ